MSKSKNGKDSPPSLLSIMGYFGGLPPQNQNEEADYQKLFDKFACPRRRRARRRKRPPEEMLS